MSTKIVSRPSTEIEGFRRSWSRPFESSGAALPSAQIGAIIGHACPHPPPRSKANQEKWLINYDDIRVDSIAMRTGVPIDKDQWGWSIGFYPASDRGLRASATAKTFDAARAAFDMAWQWLLPKFTEADFTAYRRHRAFGQWKRAMWDAGCKLPTQVADGRSTCFCRAEIGIADVESHVLAEHMDHVGC